MTFRVQKKYKGELGPKVQVSTGLGGGECRAQFITGLTYLVFSAGPSLDKRGVSICSPGGWIRSSDVEAENSERRKAAQKCETWIRVLFVAFRAFVERVDDMAVGDHGEAEAGRWKLGLSRECGGRARDGEKFSAMEVGHQNTSFMANCICRAGNVPVMTPNPEELAVSPRVGAKLVWLSRLNASARNCT